MRDSSCCSELPVQSCGGGALRPLAGEEVHCDPWRERRCRDGLACYSVAQHCDMVVDCEDNSDEDECSCVERLVKDKKCDGYVDCAGAADEADCGCHFLLLLGLSVRAGGVRGGVARV